MPEWLTEWTVGTCRSAVVQTEENHSSRIRYDDEDAAGFSSLLSRLPQDDGMIRFWTYMCFKPDKIKSYICSVNNKHSKHSEKGN